LKKKLKSTFEEKEFGVKDAVMLVGCHKCGCVAYGYCPADGCYGNIPICLLSSSFYIYIYLSQIFRKTKAQFFCAAFHVASFYSGNY
jgi:hypothetical protein